MTDKIAETVARLRRGGWDTGIATEAADLLEALARGLAAERDRAEKAEALIAYARHTDTMNDLVLMGLARDAAEARVATLEASLSGGVLTKNDSLDLLQKLAALAADRDRLAAELAEARKLLKRSYDALGEDPPLHVFNKLAFDLERALAKGDTP